MESKIIPFEVLHKAQMESEREERSAVAHFWGLYFQLNEVDKARARDLLYKLSKIPKYRKDGGHFLPLEELKTAGDNNG